MAKILGSVRTRMLTEGLPAVLADLDDHDNLRPGSTLRPKRFQGAVSGPPTCRCRGARTTSTSGRRDRRG
jgi:hypothetical protein